MLPMFNDKQKKNALTRAKLEAYAKCVWAAFAVFALVGAMLGRPVAAAIAAVVAVTWVFYRIIADAAEAYTLLGLIKDIETVQKKTKSNDGR